MKTYGVLLLMFFSICARAQLKPARLFLNTGEKLLVQGKLKGDTFVYKRYDGDKRKKVSFEDIDRIEVLITKDSTCTFRSIPVKDTEKPAVVQEIQTGKVNLYIASASRFTTMPMSSSGGFGGFSMPVTYTVENYYLQRQGEDEATHLGSNRLFTRNFTAAASDYFKDCPLLVDKIQHKEYKKRHLKEIVVFYNNMCDY